MLAFLRSFRRRGSSHAWFPGLAAPSGTTKGRDMNRRLVSLPAAMVVMGVMAAPAHAVGGDAGVALHFSAKANATLQPAADDPTGQVRNRRTLKRARGYQHKAEAAAERGLDRGRKSGERSTEVAARVLARLDKAGQMELQILRAACNDALLEQATASVDVTAQLSADLNGRVAEVTADGTAEAKATAADAVADQSARATSQVADLVDAAESSSGQLRDQLDQAAATFVGTTQTASSELSNALDSARRKAREHIQDAPSRIAA